LMANDLMKEDDNIELNKEEAKIALYAVVCLINSKDYTRHTPEEVGSLMGKLAALLSCYPNKEIKK